MTCRRSLNKYTCDQHLSKRSGSRAHAVHQWCCSLHCLKAKSVGLCSRHLSRHQEQNLPRWHPSVNFHVLNHYVTDLNLMHTQTRVLCYKKVDHLYCTILYMVILYFIMVLCLISKTSRNYPISTYTTLGQTKQECKNDTFISLRITLAVIIYLCNQVNNTN